MKILVATAETQGQRATDFCDCDEGELVFPSLIGDSHVLTGMRSLKTTTTFRVLDTANPDFSKNYPSLRIGEKWLADGGVVIPYEAKQIESLLLLTLMRQGMYDPEVDQDLTGKTDPEKIVFVHRERYHNILKLIQMFDDDSILEILDGNISLRATPSAV